MRGGVRGLVGAVRDGFEVQCGGDECGGYAGVWGRWDGGGGGVGEVCDGAGEVDVAVGEGWGGRRGEREGRGVLWVVERLHGSRCGRVQTNIKMLDVDITRLEIRKMAD